MVAVDSKLILTSLPGGLATRLRFDGKTYTAALVRQGGDPSLDLTGEDANERAMLYWYAKGMRKLPPVLGEVDIEVSRKFVPVTVSDTPRNYQAFADLYSAEVEFDQ